MQARETRKSERKPNSGHPQRRSDAVAASEPGLAPVRARAVCPCGGGCPRCAGKRSAQEASLLRNHAERAHGRGANAPPFNLRTGPAASGGGNTHPLLPIQRKLAIGTTYDPLESEADRMADRLMSPAGHLPRLTPASAESAVRRKCACKESGPGCEECSGKKPGKLQLKARSSVIPVEAPPIVHEVLRSPGKPLDAATRAFFEPRVGFDFADVRIHADERAAASADSIRARAFTSGPHIVFNRGEYSPEAAEGKRLLAHELSHVVQQGAGRSIGIQRQPKASEGSTKPNSEFSPGDTVSSITIYTISKTAIVWMRKAADSSSYSLVYALTKSDVPGGETYQGFKDPSGGLHIKKEAKSKDYLIYFSGSPDPHLLKFPPSFDVMAVARAGPPASAGGEGAGAGTGTGAGGSSEREGLPIKVLTAEQFEALTGKPASQLPDGKFVPTNQIERWKLGPNAGLPGASTALVITPPPDFVLPEGTTGVVWDGAHMYDFVVVNRQLIARGFRAGFVRQALGSFERSAPVRKLLLRIGGPRSIGGLRFDTGLGPAGISLNEGVPGSYANDALFPYLPGARAVYPLNPPPGQTGNLLESMQTQGPSLKGQTYRYSEPRPGSPALKYRLDANGCLMGTSNCINLPAELHEQALGGENLVLNEGQFQIDAIRGSLLNPEAVGPEGISPEIQGMLKPGLANNLTKALDQLEEAPIGGRLGVKSLSGPTLAQGAAGVIRAGGMVLMVYGAVKTAERIGDATPEERPLVVGEEAGSWGGGFIGNVVGSALGGAFVCAETGPGAFFCGLAFGIAGGVTGGVVGAEAGRDLAQMLVDVGKMTPAQWMNAGTMMFGTPQQKKAMGQMHEIQTGEPDPFGL